MKGLQRHLVGDGPQSPTPKGERDDEDETDDQNAKAAHHERSGVVSGQPVLNLPEGVVEVVVPAHGPFPQRRCFQRYPYSHEPDLQLPDTDLGTEQTRQQEVFALYKAAGMFTLPYIRNIVARKRSEKAAENFATVCTMTIRSRWGLLAAATLRVLRPRGFAPVLEVLHCVTQEDARNRGHGSRMVREIKAEAERQGIFTIYLLSVPEAEQFWTGRGFVRTKFPPGLTTLCLKPANTTLYTSQVVVVDEGAQLEAIAIMPPDDFDFEAHKTMKTEVFDVPEGSTTSEDNATTKVLAAAMVDASPNGPAQSSNIDASLETYNFMGAAQREVARAAGEGDASSSSLPFKRPRKD